MRQTAPTNACRALAVLLVTVLLFADRSVGRLSEESEDDIVALPPGVDNVEIHHVRVVNGVVQQDHPVVMYKEDFVTEDYDPNKNETKPSYPKVFRRRQRTRHHHARPAAQPVVEEEKILFDVLPETPLMLGDEDADIGTIELTQLAPSKEESQKKHPKKYHSRHRRDLYNPYYRPVHRTDLYRHNQQIYNNVAPSPYYLPVPSQIGYNRYPVRGKTPIYRGKHPYWLQFNNNKSPTKRPAVPDSLDNRDSFSTDTGNSLFHNSNPDDADFSVFDRPRPENRPQNSPAGNNIPQFSWQTPFDEEPERPPVWEPSTARRPTTDSEIFATPVQEVPPWAVLQPRPRPVQRQGAVFYPQEPAFADVGCQRATVMCCSLQDLGSLYDCFHRQSCDFGISKILSACS